MVLQKEASKIELEMSKRVIDLDDESFLDNQNLGDSDLNFHNQMKKLKTKEASKITTESVEERSLNNVLGSMKNIKPKQVTEGSIFERERSAREVEEEKNQLSPKRKKKRPKNLGMNPKLQ